MVDTHCHIYLEYYDDIPALINQIKEAGIEKIIVNGCDMKSNLEVLELVKKYDIVYGAIGFHPEELMSVNDESFVFLEEHLNDPKIVAVGEIGLDYHYEDISRDRQKMIFKKQLEIANKIKKPVIVHSRDAIQDTYDMMSKYDLKGVLHCYSGSLEMAFEFIKIGFFIGIGGVSTFKNASRLIDVIKGIDLEYIVLETDSPYLTPVPYRGHKNDPSHILDIVNFIASKMDISDSEISIITEDNIKRVFDI